MRKGLPIQKTDFQYGWQDEEENMGKVPRSENYAGWKGARVFVATTASLLAAGMSVSGKEAVWKQLVEWVVRRTKKRKATEDKVMITPKY